MKLWEYNTGIGPWRFHWVGVASVNFKATLYDSEWGRCIKKDVTVLLSWKNCASIFIFRLLMVFSCFKTFDIDQHIDVEFWLGARKLFDFGWHNLETDSLKEAWIVDKAADISNSLETKSRNLEGSLSPFKLRNGGSRSPDTEMHACNYCGQHYPLTILEL